MRGFKRLTEIEKEFGEDFLETPWHEIVKKLQPKVQDVFNKAIDKAVSNFLIAIYDCESPIEQLLAIEFQRRFYDCFYWSEGNFYISSQEEIICIDKRYRVDFLVRAIYKNKTYNMVVECDGHNFHEKTKEQAARDKKRDRHLTLAGYIIIRFTGSEVWNNPGKCAQEALRVIFPFI